MVSAVAPCALPLEISSPFPPQTLPYVFIALQFDARFKPLPAFIKPLQKQLSHYPLFAATAHEDLRRQTESFVAGQSLSSRMAN
jgi:hypothetical protein